MEWAGGSWGTLACETQPTTDSDMTKTRAYYNENDPKMVVWLRKLIQAGLIADGEIDDRSIVDVRPGDLGGFAQCHFFAGIGGWSYALRLAGWPDGRPVWTFSCPCQKFSSATRGRSVADDLWPHQRRLFAFPGRPNVFFGEQVAQARNWFDSLCNDVAEMDYQIGAAVLPACSVGQDHSRPRIYFVGYSYGDGKSIGTINEEMAWLQRPRCQSRELVSADGLPGRVDLLRGFGNAIVPQVAAAFIEAYVEVINGFGVEPSTT